MLRRNYDRAPRPSDATDGVIQEVWGERDHGIQAWYQLRYGRIQRIKIRDVVRLPHFQTLGGRGWREVGDVNLSIRGQRTVDKRV